MIFRKRLIHHQYEATKNTINLCKYKLFFMLYVIIIYATKLICQE